MGDRIFCDVFSFIMQFPTVKGTQREHEGREGRKRERERESKERQGREERGIEREGREWQERERRKREGREREGDIEHLPSWLHLIMLCARCNYVYQHFLLATEGGIPPSQPYTLLCHSLPLSLSLIFSH